MGYKLELNWIAEARRHVGLKENTSSTAHNPTIIEWLERMGSFNGESKAWWRNDEVPWCGLFVGHALGVAGRYVVKEWYRASAWNDPERMTRLDRPAYGCIVTFTRSGGGHVGFVVGIDGHGNLMALGGNQSNSVSIVPFSRSRATGFYWPSFKDGRKSSPLPERYDLPLLRSDGKVSTNES